MTPEQINIAIAEACGWKKVVLEDSQWECGSHSCQHKRHIQWFSPECKYAAITHEGNDRVPNFYGDLNACHEMEKVLELQDSDLFGRYVMEVARMVDLQGGYYITATAPQRCEAFLKVIGKWEN